MRARRWTDEEINTLARVGVVDAQDHLPGRTAAAIRSKSSRLARNRALHTPPTIRRPDPLRQSSIAKFDNCALSLLFSTLSPARQPSNIAALGTLFHRWVGWAIEHMRGHGETEMPIDMALEKLIEVVAQHDTEPEDVVHLPMSEIKWLRVAVVQWCKGGRFNASRVLSVEERLRGVIYVPDGSGGFYERVITGKPDVIVADPPDGVIVVDWKAGWAPPAKLGREDQEARDVGGSDREEKLSDQGFAQQVIYGILILQNYPAVQRVTLREAYVRHGEYREATIDRYNLERLTDIVGAVIAQIDRAFDAGADSPLWLPTAGPHCAMCAAVRLCPLKEWEGIPDNLIEAQLLAREWIVSAEVRKDRLPLLKGWVDENGPIPLPAGKGRREVGWLKNKTGDGRSFKLHEPDNAPESPWDERLEAVLRER